MSVILGVFTVDAFGIVGYVVYTMVKEGKKSKSRNRRR